MKRLMIASLLALAASATCAAGDIYVLPAVAALQPGFNGSLWATEVRVIKLDPAADVTVRRLWVCVPEGGFADDPSTAPEWALPAALPDDPLPPFQLLPLSGADLLQGTTSKVGAAALEVEGGDVLVYSQVADIKFGGAAFPGGQNLGAVPVYGLGQGIPPMTEPLLGASHVPWLKADTEPVSKQDPFPCTSPYRNDIGIVNPNPTPLHIAANALFFDVVQQKPQPDKDGFAVDVPPYGWIQTPFRAAREADCITVPFGQTCTCAFAGVMNLTPDTNAPYYAYASVVYTPPDPNLPQFSDPMFVPARPGAIPSVFGQAQSATPGWPRP